jgi:hypothetical protein
MLGLFLSAQQVVAELFSGDRQIYDCRAEATLAYLLVVGAYLSLDVRQCAAATLSAKLSVYSDLGLKLLAALLVVDAVSMDCAE